MTEESDRERERDTKGDKEESGRAMRDSLEMDQNEQTQVIGRESSEERGGEHGRSTADLHNLEYDREFT